MAVGQAFTPKKLQTNLDRMTRSQGGKRSYTKTTRKRGRYISARPADGSTDIAFDATFRAAAPHQLSRKDTSEMAVAIEMSDLQKKVRVRRAANLIMFVVDASWSMAAAERMIATKGAVLSLLNDAYQKRDHVGLVTFQKESAHLILPPTNSVELAQEALKTIPVGGKTPLSAGLLMAHETMTRELRRHPEIMPLMIILTDGAGNVSMTDLPPQEEAHRIARLFKESGIRSIVINTEHEAFDRGLAAGLSRSLGGECYTLRQLKAEEILETVRGELNFLSAEKK